MPLLINSRGQFRNLGLTKTESNFKQETNFNHMVGDFQLSIDQVECGSKRLRVHKVHVVFLSYICCCSKNFSVKKHFKPV